MAQRKVASTYKLTYNEEDMQPIGKLALREDNTCDICGACCEETLYLYRCYARTRPGERCDGHNRGLDPSLAYISKKCGSDLPGRRSGEAMHHFDILCLCLHKRLVKTELAISRCDLRLRIAKANAYESLI